MVLRVTTGILLVIWLGLVLAGKGGMVHLILLSALGAGFIEAVTVLRSREIIQ